MDTLKAIITDGVVTNKIVVDPNNHDMFDGVLIPDNIVVEIGYTYDGTYFIEPLSLTISNKLVELTSSCSSAIISGFTSNALGVNYTYPSKQTDQANLIAAVNSSLIPNLPTDWAIGFRCSDVNNTWSIKQHTASQIQQVLLDGISVRESYSKKLVDLTQQVNNAVNAIDVNSIVWK